MVERITKSLDDPGQLRPRQRRDRGIVAGAAGHGEQAFNAGGLNGFVIAQLTAKQLRQSGTQLQPQGDVRSGVAQVTVEKQGAFVGAGKTRRKLGGTGGLALPLHGTGDEDHLRRLAAGLGNEGPDRVAALRHHGSRILSLPEPRSQGERAQYPHANASRDIVGHVDMVPQILPQHDPTAPERDANHPREHRERDTKQSVVPLGYARRFDQGHAIGHVEVDCRAFEFNADLIGHILQVFEFHLSRVHVRIGLAQFGHFLGQLVEFFRRVFEGFGQHFPTFLEHDRRLRPSADLVDHELGDNRRAKLATPVLDALGQLLPLRSQPPHGWFTACTGAPLLLERDRLLDAGESVIQLGDLGISRQRRLDHLLWQRFLRRDLTALPSLGDPEFGVDGGDVPLRVDEQPPEGAHVIHQQAALGGDL